jgi:hypothetical protein
LLSSFFFHLFWFAILVSSRGSAITFPQNQNWLKEKEGSVFWFCSLPKLKESLDLVVVKKRQEKKVVA